MREFEIEDGALVKYRGDGGEIVIPEGVVSIGEGVFDGRIDITRVVIPDGVESIEGEAFQGCTALESVVFPEKGLDHIGEYAFSGCEALKKVVIPDGVRWLGTAAFCACKSLERVVIADSVTSMGWYAFAECKLLTEIVIPPNVKDIELGAFEDCPSLTSVILHDGIEEISDYAFYGCKSLPNIVIPDGVKRLGGNVFSNNAIIEEIVIPRNVEEIEEGFASKCLGLSVITVDPENQKYKDVDGVLYTRDGDTLVAYPCNRREKEYIIPDGVKYIEGEAFYYCENLEELFIPDSVERIVYGAFAGCKGLKRFRVSENNANYRDIDGNLYSRDGEHFVAYACGKKDKSFTVPSRVRIMGEHVFNGCPELAYVRVAEGIVLIPRWAFYHCAGLEKLVIPDSVNGISDTAFSGDMGPVKVICSEYASGMLEENEVKKTSINDFWESLKDGAVEETEIDDWFSFIAENARVSFEVMKDRIDFYSFGLERGWLSSADIDAVLEFTESLECRAMLLERKQGNSEK